MDKELIITIGRQYGSGGRYIGRMLAESLGIPFYDNELIDIIAEKSGMSKNVVQSVDEQANKFFYSLVFSGTTNNPFELSMNDKIFMLEADTIKSLAEKGSCVIVGRCANYILKDKFNTLNLFVYQNIESRIERAIKYSNIERDKAENYVKKVDKRRSAFYNYYSNQKWGSPENYDLCIDSKIGVENVVEVIKHYIEVIQK